MEGIGDPFQQLCGIIPSLNTNVISNVQVEVDAATFNKAVDR